MWVLCSAAGMRLCGCVQGLRGSASTQHGLAQQKQNWMSLLCKDNKCWHTKCRCHKRADVEKQEENCTVRWWSARVLLLYELLAPLNLLCELCIVQRRLIALREAVQRASKRLRLSLQRQNLPQRCFAGIHLYPRGIVATVHLAFTCTAAHWLVEKCKPTCSPSPALSATSRMFSWQAS